MNLTITVSGSEQILNIDLPEDFEVEDFKAYLESETNIQAKHQSISLDGVKLDLSHPSKRTLGDLKIKDNDLLVLHDITPTATTSSTGPVPGSRPISSLNALANNPLMDANIEAMRQQYLSTPGLQSQIQPEIASVLNDPAGFKEVMTKIIRAQMENESKAQEEMRKLYANPDDPSNQARIMELINKEAIEENRMNAYENSPEAFTTIHMLYIDVEVNGYAVKAFVDTGAQATIMSPGLAEKCGLSRLIDRRYVGMAKGVGSTQILGRVHSAPLKIGSQFFPCGFTILQTGVQMLLGLDMLRRYQANVDLKRNCLVIDGIETPFLAEKDCPSELTHPVGDNSGVPPTITGQRLGGNIFEPTANIFEPGANIGASSAAAKRPKLTTPANSAVGSSSSRPTAASPVVTVDPAKVAQLVDMGFDKKQAEFALQQTDNNLEMAAGLLFG